MANAVDQDQVPPGASPRLRGLARSISRPVERFLHVEAASGIVLLIVASIALIWANSPWASSYESLLHTPISLGFGDHAFTNSVHFWINDILMVLFFFVVGLEVRRELHEGILSDRKRAAIPIFAAIGGMVVPAVVYLALNPGDGAGWSIPMATDIAFAVGVLVLLGDRISASMRLLLLSVAIIDDIGAIVIIAVFHTSQLDLGGAVVGAAGISIIIVMQWIGVRNPLLYVAPGAIVWVGILTTGVHPTVAGVVVGLLTPVKPWFARTDFLASSERALTEFRAKMEKSDPDRELLGVLEQINLARREVVAPVTRIEAALHPWVAFGVMPLFALANAGVPLGEIDFAVGGATSVALGVCVGLVIGKPLGIVAFTWIAVRWARCELPVGVSWTGMVVLGLVAGIGFTMALFLGTLSFSDPRILAVSKAAVLAASLAAGVGGLVLGYMRLPRAQAGAANPPPIKSVDGA